MNNKLLLILIMVILFSQSDPPVKTELTELKPVSDPTLSMHTTMGMPNLAPAHQIQQQPPYEMMRTAAAPPSQTFIAVPSANLVQASHPMVGGQGYTMRISDNTQSSVSSNATSVGYSSVGQSVMTTSPSYPTRKFPRDNPIVKVYPCMIGWLWADTKSS